MHCQPGSLLQNLDRNTSTAQFPCRMLKSKSKFLAHRTCVHKNKSSKTQYDSFSDVGEIRVWLRADFQSGSRVLKKVFWTFSYLYLWHTMWFHAKKLLKTLKFWTSLNSLCKSGSWPQKSPKKAQTRITVYFECHLVNPHAQTVQNMYGTGG